MQQYWMINFKSDHLVTQVLARHPFIVG